MLNAEFIKMENRKRLLFFDLLKIIGITLIVVWHVYSDILKPQESIIPVIGGTGPGRIGVILFLFTCGALTELSYRKNDTLLWIFRRLARIYPAYWCSLVIALVFLQASIRSPLHALLEITSMDILAGFNYVNGPAWFIGVVVIFYLIYPLIRRVIDFNPVYIGAVLVFLGFLAREILISWPGLIPWIAEPYYYSPVGAFAFFILGSYLALLGAYPSWESNNIAAWLAEFSFYIFLIHYSFLPWRFDILLYIAVVIIFSLLLMAVDEKVQEMLKKRVFDRL